MLKKLLIFVPILFFFNCRNKHLEREMHEPAITTDTSEFALNPIQEKFSLPYPENLQLDSNSLMFYIDSYFDTSLLIHFYKTKESIKVVCYETLPTYHKDLYDYADKETHLLFFEGYSFTIDSSKWKAVKTNAMKVFADTNIQFKFRGCADCPIGLISHDSKIRRTNGANYVLYDNYARWLKDSLLKQFIEKRNPIMRKK